MKKYLLIFSLLIACFLANAQSGIYKDFTATNDSLVGATTKYFTLSGPVSGQWSGCIEVYITPSLSASDSTHVWIEASVNNSTWYKVTNFGTPLLNTGTYYSANSVTTAAGYDCKGRMGTTASGWIWTPTWYFNAPYYRVAVQHFVAAKSVKVTRARIWLKR